MPRRTRTTRRKRRPAPQSALAAFSDIAFLLIIFFIVTANLAQPQGRVTQIPAAEEGDDAELRMPTVQLSGRRIMLDDQRVPDVKTLRARLATLDLPARDDKQDRVVRLQAADDVAYQDYFEAMLAIAEAGGLITITPDAGTARPATGAVDQAGEREPADEATSLLEGGGL